MIAKVAQFVKRYRTEITLFVGVILVSLLSFAAGYLVAKEQDRPSIRFEEPV